MFGDARHQEGFRCQYAYGLAHEMDFQIRGFVKSQMRWYCTQKGLINAKASAIKIFFYHLPDIVSDMLKSAPGQQMSTIQMNTSSLSWMLIE